MATSINLAPGTQYIIAARKRRQQLYIATVLIILIVGVTWVGLGLYQWQLNKQAANLDQKIQDVEKQTSQLDNDASRIVSFEKRLSNLNALISGHISWTPLFSSIEQLLPGTTTITTIDADVTQSNVTINGSTPDVNQVSVTLANLSNTPTHTTIFDSGSVNDIVRKESKSADGTSTGVHYDFSANLGFDPKVLYINQK